MSEKAEEEPERALLTRILDALSLSPRPAMFATELAVKTSGGNDATFSQALTNLHLTGQVLVANHPPPDRHLAGSDLRIVAGPVPVVGRASAEEAADALWREWVTEFAAGHRCG